MCRFLPSGWVEQAKASGALRRARGVEDAETLLRMLMVHLVHGCSLVEAATRAREAGWARISPVALYKRLRGSEEWLRWLAERVRMQKYGPFLFGPSGAGGGCHHHFRAREHGNRLASALCGEPGQLAV